MDFQYPAGVKTQMPISNKIILEDLKLNMKSYEPPSDLQMTSSIISVTSSLTSPVDSGVQLLDSESDITSVMSMSGTAFDLNLPNDLKDELVKSDTVECLAKFSLNDKDSASVLGENNPDFMSEPVIASAQTSVMTKSDIANQNVGSSYDYGVYSSSAPSSNMQEAESRKGIREDSTGEEKQDQVKAVPENDSASVLANCDLHVSVSEEVQESGEASAPVSTPPITTPADEQIVFRRQRKKKSTKSDTPKKRVSFHEDILNSTKVDDVHIEHGFITHQPDISMSFFSWDSVRKKDVVKGRYSWAGEGDTPYYQRNGPERETRSELYVHNQWTSSSSSSCTGSVDSSSSNSLCESDSGTGNSKTSSQQKLPRSSCLKKRPRSSHTIETHVVEESTGVTPATSSRHRRSETNLLDSNIFGSLKNILSLSTSVPLAERGVPEGQEDVTMYSSSQDLQPKQRGPALGSGATRDSWVCRSVDRGDKLPEMPRLAPPLKLVPACCESTPNVLLCDSTVYEHKGISYSYEYDKFQKSFETHAAAQTNKPKSSTVYQLLLQDLNFFKKRDKEISENNLQNICNNEQPQVPSTSTPIKDSNGSKSDWSSDTTETISDLCENIPSKHLSSPKHKVKANHYSVQNFKLSEDTKSDDQTNKSGLKGATSKTSLINRFLRNVTMKKLLDAKLHKKQRTISNRCMGLYMRGIKPDEELCRDLDQQLQQEIKQNTQQHPSQPMEKQLGSNFILKLKKEVFRDSSEKLLTLYKVRSVYSSTGETRPLIVFLTNATLYVTGFRPNQTLKNHFVLPYCELSTMLIGPDAHTIHFSSEDGQMQCLVCTGSAHITSQLVGRLEMAMRNGGPGLLRGAPLPAIRHLTMRDMASLRYHICKQTPIDKDEEYFHYSLVNIQEVNCESAVTPLGPIKEGPLMFKTSTDVRWETGYFILKGGVLYMLSSPSNRLPMRVLPLGGGACVGAHRTPYCMRPHTFELLLGSLTLQLAAPDEYVASDWLQLLVQTASGLYGNHELNHAQCCTLLLTSSHLVTMRETFPMVGTRCEDEDMEPGAHTLGCAAIVDVTAVRIPLAEQSWCVLEFACREVHETSGDLVLYFATNAELERFLSNLEMLWSYNNIKGDSFPLSTISEDEPINKKCVDTYRTQQSAWAALGVALD